MSEQVWYVFQNETQLGPFSALQIKQMVDNKMIPQDAYLFKVGWKDWRPIEETYNELGLGKGREPSIVVNPERRSQAPRATIKGRVIVHNNGQLVIGAGVNISSTGIFVETVDQIFTVGENLKLSVRAEGFSKAFNVVAQVVRFNSDPNYSKGYGLKFENLEKQVAKEIQEAVDEQNRGKNDVSDKLAQ
jgi:Tfp pilus assembly protein PilZ